MRRVLSLSIVLVFFAVGLSAGTITSISPSSFGATTSEEFITINGTDLGTVVRYEGPPGTFDVPANTHISTRVVAWVPTIVLATPGSYKVYVLGGRGLTSGPAPFTINGKVITKLKLILPEVVLWPAKSRDGAYVKFDVSAVGGEDPEPVVNCDPVSGSFFKFGQSEVRCVATNRFGEQDTASFKVNVIDGIAPKVSVPESFTVEADGPEGARVKFESFAEDDLDGVLIPSCSPASESLFPVGTTEVVCTALDAFGNQGNGNFTVEVKWKSLVLHVPDGVVAEAENAKGAWVSYSVSATSPDDPEPTIKCDPPSDEFFELGTTTVRCYAEDILGNTDEASFDVSVKDTVGPFIATITGRPDYLAPTGEMVLVDIALDVFDIVDPEPKCAITDVTANEPIDGDWRIAGDLSVYLAAKYNSKEGQRNYSVNVKCVDSLENISLGSASVVVADKPPQQLAAPGAPSKKKSGIRNN